MQVFLRLTKYPLGVQSGLCVKYSSLLFCVIAVVMGWVVLYCPVGCSTNSILVDLVSLQGAASLVILQRGIKEEKKERKHFGTAIHFSIF